MFSDFPLQFERPGWLLLLLLVVPIWLLAWRSRSAVSRSKLWTSLILRTIVTLLLAASLSHPTLVRRGEGLTLMIVADESQSVPLALRQRSETFLKGLPETKQPEDRVGTIVVGRTAEILSRPEATAIVPGLSHPGETDATNLAAGLRQALALLPRDTASRILLVSDFNENIDSVMEEVEAAQANSIPIDVLPLEFEHPNEVVFEGIRAPPRARVGQSAEVRMFLRSQAAAKGRLSLRLNGEPIDLDPNAPGNGLDLALEPGPKVVSVQVPFEEGGAQRFDAIFEPADTADDVVRENNVASAVTFVSGGGRVLIVDETGSESALLTAALQQGGLSVDIRNPEELTQGPAFLNGFDAIILANVPRWVIDASVDRALHAYAHDLGGGLLMLGGDKSFGAGGWIDSEVAKALPVKLDPPATRQLVRGALALIVHSCEMDQGNFWSQQVAIAAIEALSRLDLVGIIVFGIGGSSWHFPLQEVGDKVAAIAAARSMVVGDMPDFESSVGTAYQGLLTANAGQKHIIIISDGDPAPPSPQLLQKVKAAKITISTVMVAGHGTPQDLSSMQQTAQFTGGNFHNVTDPKKLPKIFTKEATVVTRSLIAEGDFRPQVVSALPGPIRGFGAVPPVRGYVVTVPREGLAQTPITIPTKDANDPLYAFWNYGIGRVVAFTSDATGRWGSAWLEWGEYKAFWEQTVRWLMRPAAPPNLSVRTRVEGETAIVELEAVGEDAGFMNFLRTDAVVLGPDGSGQALQLQQVGPGRYRGQFEASETGAYLVNVTVPVVRDGENVPASVQAAVSVPYAKEFRAVRDNAVLGRRIAERTGGRVLSLGDPRLAAAFDRTGLAVPRSARRVWDLMAILAAALFLVDVAVRRLSFEPDAARRLAERALGRTEAVGDATVAAWKKARRKTGERTVSADAGTDAERAARAEANRGAAGARFEAGEGGPSMDVAGEARGESGDESRRGGAAAERREDATPQSEEQQSMSRLLRAKRRARGDADESAGPGGGEERRE